MAWYNFMTGKTEKPVTRSFAIPVKREEFKGEVEQKKFQSFTQDVGEDHPFNPKITQGLYSKYGFVTGIVDKYVDYIWGAGFHVTCEEKGGEKAITILNNWIHETQFYSVGRQWVKDALIAQGGFLELAGAKNKPVTKVKTLNPAYMYVRRDNKGNILGYTQYVGGFDRFSKNKAIPFEPFQVAPLFFNKVGDSAYGLGIVYPNVPRIDQLIGLEKDMHTIVHRKANSPLHIKIGSTDPANPYIPNQEAINAVRNDLQTLTPKTEWATDPYWSIEAIDTGDIGGKFDVAIKHDVDMLIFGFQVPEVLLGRGSIPEGLAQVQEDAFQRRTSSYQEEIEKVLEEQVFRRVLLAAGIDMRVEVVWGQPSNKEKKEKIAQLQLLIGTMGISPKMRSMLELELAEQLGFDKSELEDAQEEMENEMEEPMPRVPGQNAPRENVEKAVAVESTNNLNAQITPHLEVSSTTISSSTATDPFSEEATLEAWLGFNYKEYLAYILSAVKKDSFSLLVAETAEQASLGKLTTEQVDSLKKVLEKSFAEGSDIKTIARRIETDVQPGNLYEEEPDGTKRVLASAENRPLNIARTESTRMANLGTKNYYQANNVEEYRWVASVGKRTCTECAGLNGTVFKVNEAPKLPPIHSMCRCSISALTRLG